MSVMSWQLPRAPLRDRVLFLLVVGTALTGLLAAVVLPLVGPAPAFRARASLVFAAAGAFALGHLRDQHPFDSFGPANAVTSLRLMLVSMVAALLGEAASPASAVVATALALVVTALDGVDGWLARRSGMASAFGARFDMETDALLILVLALLAWQHGSAGAWIVLAGLMRYGFVAAGWVWPWMNAPLPPSQRRKAVCVVQIVGLSAIVAPAFPAVLDVLIGAGTLALLSYSFLVDVLWLRRSGA